MIPIKKKHEIAIMREGGRILSRLFLKIEEFVKEGATGIELDKFAENYINKAGATPAFKGYHGFPATICVSLNEMVVHGIPAAKKFKLGDLVSIDIGLFYKGFCSDSARTFLIGDVPEPGRKLKETAIRSFEAGLGKCRAGMRLGDVSAAVQETVEKEGFSVIRELVGHGVGVEMHEEPQVANFGTEGTGPELIPGMTFALEPMIAAGGYDIKVLADGWGVVTADKSLSAHYEHTIAITDKEPILLTA